MIYMQAARMSANRKINFKKDYYDILCVPQDASFEQIRKSYRKKMLKFHPDRHEQNGINRQSAHKMAIELNEAYQILVNKASRREYDAGNSHAHGERRSAEEEERLREEEERRRKARAEEQRKKEEEEQKRTAEQRRRDEEAARERIRLEREKRIAEEQRKRAEQLRKRMEEYEIGMEVSVICSIISGIYILTMIYFVFEMTFIKSGLCSIGISAVLMLSDFLLYSKMRNSEENVPFSLWIWGLNDDSQNNIFIPSTFATYFAAFFLYYPIVSLLTQDLTYYSSAMKNGAR
ncbi:MAG: DnaJ domain-containing protein [Victivallales bacterium]|jgi:hypothetical protein